MTKTLIPTDIRDFLAISGMISAIGLFYRLFLFKPFFIDTDAVFFLLIGIGILVAGNVINFKWARDGLQVKEDWVKVVLLVLGLFSVGAGLVLLFGSQLPENISSIAGGVALIMGLIIGVDYYKKNK